MASGTHTGSELADAWATPQITAPAAVAITANNLALRGSTSEAVLARAKIPVLIVPARSSPATSLDVDGDD